MESRRLNLSGSEDMTATSSRIEDYALDGEIKSAVLEMLETQKGLEFWSPEYQAWEPILTKYLKTGGVPQLTTKYLGGLFDKRDDIAVPASAYTQAYQDIHSLYTTVNGELFKGVRYSDIVDFQNTICNFLVSQKKSIWRDIHTDAVMNEVMSTLLNEGTYRGLMCALILCRNHQAKDFEFQEKYVLEIASRIDTWRQTYAAEFRKIQTMLGDRNSNYIWYHDSVLECVDAAFTDCANKDKRMFVPARITIREEKVICQMINGYLNGGPLGIRPLTSTTYAFDAMFQIFYNNVAENPNNAENCHHALCVRRSAFDTMVNYLFDFYWNVQYGDLGKMLYDRVLLMEDSESSDINPADYRASLLYRGFPLNVQ